MTLLFDKKLRIFLKVFGSYSNVENSVSEKKSRC